MRFRHALIALAVASLAGCSTAVAGTAVPIARDPLAGSTVFGDQKTVNWCSMVSLEPVKRFGTPERPADEGFDSCYVYVTTGKDQGFGLSVGAPDYLYPEDEAFDVEQLAGGLRVTTVNDEADSCAKMLVLRDGIQVSVFAQDWQGGVEVDMCEPVDAVMAHVTDRITSGQTAGHHRISTATLRTADACAATPAADVTALAGFAKVAATPVPLGHVCVWEAPGRGAGPMVVVSLGVELGLRSDPTVRREMVEGQEVLLGEDAEEGVCAAIAQVRPVAGSAAGGDHLEVVTVFLDPGAAGSATACADAAHLALATRHALTR